jgi:hypothetical protein
MSETKKTVANATDEMVEIELFYDGERYKDDVFVQVNGKSVLIKRGEKVKVTKAVAEVIKNSLQQKAQAAELMSKLQRDYQAASKYL